jgi:hypothetical protein
MGQLSKLVRNRNIKMPPEHTLKIYVGFFGGGGLLSASIQTLTVK